MGNSLSTARASAPVASMIRQSHRFNSSGRPATFSEQAKTSFTSLSGFTKTHAAFLTATGAVFSAVIISVAKVSNLYTKLAEKDAKLEKVEGEFKKQLAEKDTNLERAMRLLEEKQHNKHLDLIAHGDYLEFRNRMMKSAPQASQAPSQ